MDTLFKDKIDKTTSWSSEKEVWEWPELRDLGRSTSDTWEQVIPDNQITGRIIKGSRDLDDKANMIHKEKITRSRWRER
jgi:hypothetical protein